jgi:hypothetical protein
MSDFKQAENVPPDEVIRDIDRLFGLFDRIEWLQFVGGEIFLNPDMAQVYRYCLDLRDRFERLILETNATLLPRDEEIAALRKYGDGVKVMISDYGKLSRCRDETVSLLEKNGIPYVLKKYYGDEQHFGGWIDNTGLRDLGEADGVVTAKAAGCAQVRLENMHCYRGKLHRCSNSLFLHELGLFEPNPRDFLDLYDDTLTSGAKRSVIADFYKTPRKSCRFCSWKDADTLQRYDAAEQIMAIGGSR